MRVDKDNDHWKCGFNVERASIDPRMISHKDIDLSIIQIRIYDISQLEFLVKGLRDIPLCHQPLADVITQHFAKKRKQSNKSNQITKQTNQNHILCTGK